MKWRLALCVALVPRTAAASGASFGEAPREAALAGAVAAGLPEPSTIAVNPAGLAGLDGAMVTLAGHVGEVDLSFQRSNEPAVELDRLIAGWSAGGALALPGPLSPFRIGVVAHLPAAHALRLVAPSRQDEPTFPLYGDRAERTAVAGAIALALFDRLGFGAAATLTPTLDTPTVVSYEPGRGDSPDENVVVDLERELRLGLGAVLGVQARATDWLTAGVAWRQRIDTGAAGPNDTRAGTLLLDDRIDFYDFLEPEQLSYGVALSPLTGFRGEVDLGWQRWSAYRTIHNRLPDPPFDDVHVLRLGVEQAIAAPLTVRAGYGYEPSPVPPQSGVTNLLDGDRHVLALGAGWDWRAHGWAPLRIDGHVRAHLLDGQRASKDFALLGDADPNEPGQQIVNLGYPSFEAEGRFWQVGLALSIFFAPKEARP